MSTIKFKNPTDRAVHLQMIGLGTVQPNGEIDVPLYVAAPTRRDNGSRGLSAIEKCAPQLVPVDPEIEKAWQTVPDPLPPKSLMVSTMRREPDEPAGVKALREAAENLAAKAASEPKTSAKAGAAPKVGG